MLRNSFKAGVYAVYPLVMTSLLIAKDDTISAVVAVVGRCSVLYCTFACFLACEFVIALYSSDQE